MANDKQLIALLGSVRFRELKNARRRTSGSLTYCLQQIIIFNAQKHRSLPLNTVAKIVAQSLDTSRWRRRTCGEHKRPSSMIVTTGTDFGREDKSRLGQACGGPAALQATRGIMPTQPCLHTALHA